MVTTTHAQTWINDHLDLLNYAKQIGDLQWQEEILHKLKQSDTELYNQLQSQMQTRLWQQFDFINQRVLELYRQARDNNGNTTELSQLKEELWGLKLQRIRVVQQLREL